MIEVLRASHPQQRQHWEELVAGSPCPDVYYRPGYLVAYETTEPVQALALVVELEGVRALVPLLVRDLGRVGGLPVREGKDAYSPYGYGGVLWLSPSPRGKGAEALVEEVRDWARASGSPAACCVSIRCSRRWRVSR